MHIVEYRITHNLSVKEFEIGQLWSVANSSKNETQNGEGVEFVKNEPFENGKQKGQYTYKIYRLSSKVPALVRAILPSESLELHEESWNCFPYTKTVLTNGYMKDKFSLITESIHIDNDRGELENALNKSESELNQRKIQLIDISEPLKPSDYTNPKDEIDLFPNKFQSSKTNRGPLTNGFQKNCDPVMTCYKLVYAHFKWFPISSKVESMLQYYIHETFKKFHRRLFCWIDEWHGLTLEQVREFEIQTKLELEQKFNSSETLVTTKLTNKSGNNISSTNLFSKKVAPSN